MAEIFEYALIVPKCKDCKRLLNIELKTGLDNQFFSRFTESGKEKLRGALGVVANYIGEYVMVSTIVTCGCPGKQIDNITTYNPLYIQTYGQVKAESLATKWVIQDSIFHWGRFYGCI